MSRLQRLLLFLSVPVVSSLASSFALAVQKSHVEQLFERFWSSPAIELKLRREIFVELVSEKRSAQGTLKFAKGLFRLSIKSPERSELVYNGKTIWQAQELGQDLGGGWQIVKTENVQALKASAFMKLLFGEKDVFNQLSLVSKDKPSPDLESFTYAPKNSDDFGSIKQFTIEMNVAKMALTKIQYVDNNDNKVTYDFLTFKKLKSLAQTEFNYTPPANSKVTEYK